uniref:Uncharacterized protein n=1 Tax=Romanomermis culicivorax TaxID=13658 RepID=A0A915J6P9_ROMCU
FERGDEKSSLKPPPAKSRTLNRSSPVLAARKNLAGGFCVDDSSKLRSPIETRIGPPNAAVERLELLRICIMSNILEISPCPKFQEYRVRRKFEFGIPVSFPTTGASSVDGLGVVSELFKLLPPIFDELLNIHLAATTTFFSAGDAARYFQPVEPRLPNLTNSRIKRSNLFRRRRYWGSKAKEAEFEAKDPINLRLAKAKGRNFFIFDSDLVISLLGAFSRFNFSCSMHLEVYVSFDFCKQVVVVCIKLTASFVLASFSFNC